MKLRMIDLMDLYYGPDYAKLESKEAASQHQNFILLPSKHKKTRIPGKYLLIASCFLCVICVASALIFPFSGQSTAPTSAYAEGDFAAYTVPEGSDNFNVFDNISTYEKSIYPDTANAETNHTAAITTYAIQGTLDDRSDYCSGNMFSVNGQYYTLSDEGPIALETTNLHTFVELYGSWEVDIDYAIVDSEIVFNNNVSTQSYAIVDGQRLTQQEYHDGGMSAVYGNLTWYEPSVAYALPLSGSSDTVILRIYRQDKPAYERVAYPFLYNIATGEVTDPLANVPELFDHGYFCSAIFNPDVTYAIVSTYEGNEYHTYLCDLETGDMTNILTLSEEFISTFSNTDTVLTPRSDHCTWADSNTLLFWVMEDPAVDESACDDTTVEYTDADYCYWLCFYDVNTKTMNDQIRGASFDVLYQDTTHRYLFSLAGTTDNVREFQIIDTTTGAIYHLDIAFSTYGWRETADQAIIEENKDIYFVDATKGAWIHINEYLELPDHWSAIRFCVDDWLILVSDDAVYCYQIPDDLPMTPWA